MKKWDRSFPWCALADRACPPQRTRGRIDTVAREIFSVPDVDLGIRSGGVSALQRRRRTEGETDPVPTTSRQRPRGGRRPHPARGRLVPVRPSRAPTAAAPAPSGGVPLAIDGERSVSGSRSDPRRRRARRVHRRRPDPLSAQTRQLAMKAVVLTAIACVRDRAPPDARDQDGPGAKTVLRRRLSFRTRRQIGVKDDSMAQYCFRVHETSRGRLSTPEAQRLGGQSAPHRRARARRAWVFGAGLQPASTARSSDRARRAMTRALAEKGAEGGMGHRGSDLDAALMGPPGANACEGPVERAYAG